MAKKSTFEIYEGLTSRKKKYAIIGEHCQKTAMAEAAKYMMKLNHCSAAHIDVTYGYIFKGQLYFIKPNINAKFVHVLTYIR